MMSPSLQKGYFSEELKIARVTLTYKADDVNEIGNYRPISGLPCFSKILEKIIYNRLFKYLTTHEILYKKQFGFQKGHSTENAIMQLTDQINNSFEKIILRYVSLLTFRKHLTLLTIVF